MREPFGSSEQAARRDAQQPGAAEVESWLIDRLASLLEIDRDAIDVSEPMDAYGLGSTVAVGLTGELSEWLGRDLSPVLAWEYPSIAALARYLAGGPGITQAMDDKPVVSDREPIAIVGIGCRFPGAAGPDAFWRLLRDGVDAITQIPADRPHLLAAFDPGRSRPGTLGTRWGGFLADIDQFDAPFFGISPREASRMDPQQRLLLEAGWEALEDAGIVPERLAGSRTGVFVGLASNDYGQLQLGDLSQIDVYAGSGNAASIAANRLSYLLDLKGPSLALDTACSSSLVAVHLACESLRAGESSLALAAGVNLTLTPHIGIGFAEAGLIGADGRCKAFDARADGYVRGEGVGVVVLKPMSRAVADGDPIYALIRGSAVNHDGRTNGLMAPSPSSQAAVLRDAYRRAEVAPLTVHYVEAQGTGTLLGDQIEVMALGEVLTSDRSPERPCLIGSVKTNIGHLEAASGIAGLIKVALMLRHRAIPPSLHFEQPNPHIPFDDLPLRVAASLSPWPEHHGPALAGVSAFGFGGTNAHVVLAEVAESQAPVGNLGADGDERAYLLPLSARTPEALHALAERYRDFLASTPFETASSLRDIACTASVRRSHHPVRLAVIGATRDELREQLDRFVDDAASAGAARGCVEPGRSRRPRLAFVCSDLETHWAGMGRELFAGEPVFCRVVQECDHMFRRYLGVSVAESLAASEGVHRANDDKITQPEQFTLQVALAALWRSWGVEPEAVLGCGMGVGEVAAAHIAGALSLEDAAQVIVQRARLLKQLDDRTRAGADGMTTDDANEGEGRSFGLGVTGHQGKHDRSSAVAETDIDAFRHELAAALDGIMPRMPELPVYSRVGHWAGQGRRFGPGYWAGTLGVDGRLADVLPGLIDTGHDLMIELGPPSDLPTVIDEALSLEQRQSGRAMHVLPSMQRGVGERATMLAALGRLYVTGYPIDWHRLFPDSGGHVHLPTYPWQRERYWFEVGLPPSANPGAELPGYATTCHPLLQRYRPGAHPVWESELRRDRVGEGLSQAMLIDMALASAGETLEAVELADLEFGPALSFGGSDRRLQLVHAPGRDGTRYVECFSQNTGDQRAGSWALHLSGAMRSVAVPGGGVPSDVDLASIQARCDTWILADDLRGTALHGIERLWTGEGEALALLRLDGESLAVWLEPSIIRAVIGMVGVIASDGPRTSELSGVDRVRVLSRFPASVFVFVCLVDSDGDAARADAHVLDESGTLLAELMGVRFWPSTPSGNSGGGHELTYEVLATLAPAARQDQLVSYFRAALAGVLGAPEERIDPRQRLDTLGLDSLMAMQLKNRIAADFGVSLDPVDLLLGPTLEELAALVAERLPESGEPARMNRAGDGAGLAEAVPSSLDAGLDGRLARLDELSDEELDDVLAEMLGSEGGHR